MGEAAVATEEVNPGSKTGQRVILTPEQEASLRKKIASQGPRHEIVLQLRELIDAHGIPFVQDCLHTAIANIAMERGGAVFEESEQ